MKNYIFSIEKLRADAAAVALIRNLATDTIKRNLYHRLHSPLLAFAAEVQKAMQSVTMPSSVRLALADQLDPALRSSTDVR